MTRVTRVALIGLASAAFAGSSFMQAALAQSAGPIQTLPWGAKQRPKSTADAKEADNQQNAVGTPPPKPVEAAPEPLNVKPQR